jgi:peptide/nickel transport system substrate-binding protein
MTGVAGGIVGGQYRLIDQIAQGGTSRAWRAMDETLGREVAIKEIALPPGLSEDDRQRYIAQLEQ